MKRITIDALDSFFDYINRSDYVFWLRNKDYTRQIYVSSSFEDIWGVPVSSLYEMPDIIKNSVIADDCGEKILKLDKVREDFTQSSDLNIDIDAMSKVNQVFWRIKTPQGDVRYVYDEPFMLTDRDGEHIGFGGIGESLAYEDWQGRRYAQGQKHVVQTADQLKSHVFSMLRKEAGLIVTTSLPNEGDLQKGNGQEPIYCANLDGRLIEFTRRESQCLYYLKQGKTAKEAAAILFISPRTVEFHLANAKNKLSCSSKIALFSKIRIKNT